MTINLIGGEKNFSSNIKKLENVMTKITVSLELFLL